MIWDVVVIGAGPAGLSAALNLARARRSVLVLDSNRPRNSATFASHGYLGHDGISPLQLRSLGREELSAYPDAQFAKTVVSRVESTADGFVVTDKKVQSLARTVLLATGLLETFPAVPSMRLFYGTRIHSCIACDAYEYADQPIALIGETDDLVARALHLAQWSRDLVVFTNGVASIADVDEERLARRGIRVDRRPIDDFVGDREGLTGIRLADGDFVPRVGAFVRQQWAPALGFASGLGLATDSDALVEVDANGRSSFAGVYAAGDCTPPGPQQVAVAAGAGATVADAINRDLVTLDS